jgi:thiol-disulfide isomerase/thioredoxin
VIARTPLFGRELVHVMKPHVSMSRRIALTLALAALLGAPGSVPARAASVSGPAPKGEKIREILERHPLRTLDGRTVRYDELVGHVVVLNFWASWCPPCRRELPDLDALDHEIEASGGRVLAVSIDEDDRNVRRFVHEHSLTLCVARDGPAGIASALDLKQIPYSVVLDRQGGVALAAPGAGKDAVRRVSEVARRLSREGETATQDGGKP